MFYTCMQCGRVTSLTNVFRTYCGRVGFRGADYRTFLRKTLGRELGDGGNKRKIPGGTPGSELFDEIDCGAGGNCGLHVLEAGLRHVKFNFTSILRHSRDGSVIDGLRVCIGRELFDNWQLYFRPDWAKKAYLARARAKAKKRAMRAGQSVACRHIYAATSVCKINVRVLFHLFQQHRWLVADLGSQHKSNGVVWMVLHHSHFKWLRPKQQAGARQFFEEMQGRGAVQEFGQLQLTKEKGDVFKGGGQFSLSGRS